MRTTIRAVGLWLMGVTFAAACSTAAEPKKAAPPPPPAASSSAERIERPVNVSFSTYSKDWPVGWVWIDPDEDRVPTTKDVRKGVLRIRIPTGKNLAGAMTSPRYLKSIEGDFQIETRVAFAPKENYQGAGLLVYADDNHYLRLERAYGGVSGGAEGIRLDVMDAQGYRPLATPDDIPTAVPLVDLKIIRTGNIFLAYWRENEASEWREVGGYQSGFPNSVRAGLVASNTAREVTVEFGYIKLEPVGGN